MNDFLTLSLTQHLLTHTQSVSQISCDSFSLVPKYCMDLGMRLTISSTILAGSCRGSVVRSHNMGVSANIDSAISEG